MAKQLPLFGPEPDQAENMAYTAEYAERRKSVEAYFDGARCEPNTKLFLLHDGSTVPYTLEVNQFTTKPGCWGYAMGSVFMRGETTPLFKIKRNYPHFWYCFVPKHPSGDQFLLCGEDYQGMTVLNLTKRTERVYFPRAALRGVGWCATSGVPSNNGKTIALTGCIWGGPEDLRLLDFRDPLMLPLPLVWEDTSSCSFAEHSVKFSAHDLFLEYHVPREYEIPDEFTSEEK